MSRVFVVIAITLSATACGSDPALLITADGIRRDVEALSADSMGGRSPGTEGEARTVAYIAGRFADMQLEKAGAEYALPFDLVGMTKNDAQSRLTIRGQVVRAKGNWDKPR